MVISTFFICSNGTYILRNVAITINGPKGIYSSDFFNFVTSNIMLSIAPIRNETNVIIIIFDNPKYNPNAPINFTSPKPMASFP